MPPLPPGASPDRLPGRSAEISAEISQISQPDVTAQAALAAGAPAAVGIDADGGEMYEVEELFAQHVDSGLLGAPRPAPLHTHPTYYPWLQALAQLTLAEGFYTLQQWPRRFGPSQSLVKLKRISRPLLRGLQAVQLQARPA